MQLKNSLQGLLCVVLTVMSSTAFPGWHYQSKKSAMTAEITKGAWVTSKNVHEFAFPYQGGTRARLIEFLKPKYSSVCMEVNHGQFTCVDGCTVTVRLDDNPPEQWKVALPDNGSTDSVSFYDRGAVADKLVAAKRFRIEATFFKEGQRMFDFDVRGLKWPLPVEN